MRFSFHKVQIAAAAVSCALLVGCTGTSTYGTGKSQEAQLLEDIGALAAIGTRKKKPKIDYMARPKLVKPTTTASLPTPAEKTEDQAGYFPTNPEEKRQQLLKQIEEAEKNGEAVPEEVQAMRRASIASPGDPAYDRGIDKWRADQRSVEQQKEQAAEFAKRKAELRGISGAAPRRYLTEPPSVYRTPKTSAPIGVTGEKEKDPYKRASSTNLFDILTGRD